MTQLQLALENRIEDRLKEVAEATHLEFLQEMYPHFGLDVAPNPIPIIIKSSLQIGGGYFCGDFIEIGMNRVFRFHYNTSKEMVKHTAAHETAHYLHSSFFEKTNDFNIYSRLKNGESCTYLSRDNHLLAELISELGVYIFYKKRGHTEEYISRTGLSSPVDHIIHNFFCYNTEKLFQQIAQKKEMSKVTKILKKENINTKAFFIDWSKRIWA